MVREGVNPEVVQEEGVESKVEEVVHLPGVLVDTRKGGSLMLKGAIVPFVGETPTGEENTRRVKFPPRSSRNFFNYYLKTKYFKDKQLSVDHFPVNPSAKHQFRSDHQTGPVPHPGSRTRNFYSHGSRPRSVYSRQSVNI